MSESDNEYVITYIEKTKENEDAPALQTPSNTNRHRGIRDLFGKEGMSESEQMAMAKEVKELETR